MHLGEASIFSQSFDGGGDVAAGEGGGAGGEGAFRGGEGEPFGEGDFYPVFGYGVELGGYFCCGGGVAAVSADVGQGADVAVVFITPADDAGVPAGDAGDVLCGHGVDVGDFCGVALGRGITPPSPLLR